MQMQNSKIPLRRNLYFKMLFFFVILFSFTQLNAQTLKTDSIVPVLDACGDYQQFAVSVVKGNQNCTGGNLKIEIPEGFEIQSGSVKLNGVVQQVNVVPNQPVLVSVVFGTDAITQEAKITFNVKALCDVIGNTSTVAAVNYNFTDCNVDLSESSDPINIRYAVLRVKVNPDNILGNLNDEISRNI